MATASFARDEDRIEAEFGDVMFALVNLAPTSWPTRGRAPAHHRPVHAALRSRIEARVHEANGDWQARASDDKLTLELDGYWEQGKRAEAGDRSGCAG